MTFPSNSDFVSLTGLDDSVNSKLEMFFKLFSKVVFSLATLSNLSFLKELVKGFGEVFSKRFVQLLIRGLSSKYPSFFTQKNKRFNDPFLTLLPFLFCDNLKSYKGRRYTC